MIAKVKKIKETSDSEEFMANLEHLNKELTKFKLAVENSSDHIVITDQDGIVIYANKAVERSTGYKIEEVLNRKAGVLWGKKMTPEFYIELWKVIKIEKRSYVGEVVNVRKNGEVYHAHVSISPVLDENHDILFFVGVERDITEEREMDKVKNEFISFVSHQMRTPLASIGLSAEMLLSGVAVKALPEQKKYLKIISQEIKGMADMIELFLNVSRIELGKFHLNPEKTDIKKFTDSVIDKILPLIKSKKINLKKAYGKNIPLINIDKNIMYLILENLLSNSVKYTDEGGCIIVKIEPTKKDIIVSVEDTGGGIPEEEHPKIFTKFYRAPDIVDKKVKSSGLGLYLVKKSIEEAGGDVWFESKLNKGTTFYVSVPLEGMKKHKE